MSKSFDRSLIVNILIPIILLAFAAGASGDEEASLEHFNKGIKAAQKGDTAVAIMSYKAAINEDPGFVDAYKNLGAIQFAQKAYDDALSTYKTATEKDPTNIEAFANLGKVEHKLRHYAEATTAFKKAIELDGQNSSLYKELGRVYYATKNYKELVATLGKCHEVGEGDNISYFMLGKGLQRQEKNTEAIAALKKSAQLKPKYYNAHNSLGQIYLSMGKFSLAVKAFDAARKANKKKFRASYNYAIAVESLNPDDIERNIVVWEEFVRKSKKYPKAKKDIGIAEQHVKDLKDRKEILDMQNKPESRVPSYAVVVENPNGHRIFIVTQAASVKQFEAIVDDYRNKYDTPSQPWMINFFTDTSKALRVQREWLEPKVGDYLDKWVYREDVDHSATAQWASSAGVTLDQW